MKYKLKHQLSRWLPKKELKSVIEPLEKHKAPYEVRLRISETGKKEWAVYVD